MDHAARGTVEEIGEGMTRSLSFQRIVVAVALARRRAVVVPVATSSTPVSAACTWCAGGEYHALTPARILDTRPATSINDVAPLGAKPLAPPPTHLRPSTCWASAACRPSRPTCWRLPSASPSSTPPGPASSAPTPPVRRRSTRCINFAPARTCPTWPSSGRGTTANVTITITGSGVGTATCWSTCSAGGPPAPMRPPARSTTATSAAPASSRRPRQAASSTHSSGHAPVAAPIGRCRSVAPSPSVPTPSPTSCPTAPTWWAC
jgi:hypothetical protein